jgi:hypothetical protein
MALRHTPLLAVPLFGCPKPTDVEEAAPIPPVIERTTADGLIVQEVDLNGDHKADIVNTLRPRANADALLMRKESDLNLDGHADVITVFTDEGEVEREEIDGDFDGRFDWVDHYQSKQRVMSEVDSDGDGKMDIFSYYEGTPPRISRKERDTNNDGRIDFWERFDEFGKVTKTGRDTDGDGKMDERE